MATIKSVLNSLTGIPLPLGCKLFSSIKPICYRLTNQERRVQPNIYIHVFRAIMHRCHVNLTGGKFIQFSINEMIYTSSFDGFIYLGKSKFQNDLHEEIFINLIIFRSRQHKSKICNKSIIGITFVH